MVVTENEQNYDSQFQCILSRLDNLSKNVQECQHVAQSILNRMNEPFDDSQSAKKSKKFHVSNGVIPEIVDTCDSSSLSSQDSDEIPETDTIQQRNKNWPSVLLKSRGVRLNTVIRLWYTEKLYDFIDDIDFSKNGTRNYVKSAVRLSMTELLPFCIQRLSSFLNIPECEIPRLEFSISDNLNRKFVHSVESYADAVDAFLHSMFKECKKVGLLERKHDLHIQITISEFYKSIHSVMRNLPPSELN